MKCRECNDTGEIALVNDFKVPCKCQGAILHEEEHVVLYKDCHEACNNGIYVVTAVSDDTLTLAALPLTVGEIMRCQECNDTGEITLVNDFKVPCHCHEAEATERLRQYIYDTKVAEELSNICLNGPLWPGDALSRDTAKECLRRGWAKRNEDGLFVATAEGRTLESQHLEEENEREAKRSRCQLACESPKEIVPATQDPACDDTGAIIVKLEQEEPQTQQALVESLQILVESYRTMLECVQRDFQQLLAPLNKLAAWLQEHAPEMIGENGGAVDTAIAYMERLRTEQDRSNAKAALDGKHCEGTKKSHVWGESQILRGRLVKHCINCGLSASQNLPEKSEETTKHTTAGLTRAERDPEHPCHQGHLWSEVQIIHGVLLRHCVHCRFSEETVL